MLVSNRSIKQKRGFSLIELLIVISIMGLITSIVVPETFTMLEQHQAHLEQKQLVDFLKKQKYQAYLLEQPISIEFIGAEMKSSLGSSIAFEHIYSDSQTITITELGNFDQDAVSFYFRGRPTEKVLGDL